MIKGKALLVIERTDSEYCPFHVDVFIQSTSHEDPYEGRVIMEQEFEYLAYKSGRHAVPAAAKKLKEGERIRLYVVYECRWHKDHDGEYDSEIFYHKERVLRRQRAKP